MLCLGRGSGRWIEYSPSRECRNEHGQRHRRTQRVNAGDSEDEDRRRTASFGGLKTQERAQATAKAHLGARANPESWGHQAHERAQATVKAQLIARTNHESTEEGPRVLGVCMQKTAKTKPGLPLLDSLLAWIHHVVTWRFHRGVCRC